MVRGLDRGPPDGSWVMMGLKWALLYRTWRMMKPDW
jgi:hypothetical protein